MLYEVITPAVDLHRGLQAGEVEVQERPAAPPGMPAPPAGVEQPDGGSPALALDDLADLETEGAAGAPDQAATAGLVPRQALLV